MSRGKGTGLHLTPHLTLELWEEIRSRGAWLRYQLFKPVMEEMVKELDRTLSNAGAGSHTTPTSGST